MAYIVKPYYDHAGITLYHGDCREILKGFPDESVNCCVTSPPYFGLRDYGVEDQIGLEPTITQYVSNLVSVFSEVKRVLRWDGTLWLNIGDSYAANRGYQVPDGKVGDVGNSKGSIVPDGLKPKDLIGVPWRVAFALQSDGWYLRSDIIWSKPNAMPESVTDRCTKSHEYLFMLAKSERYYFDAAAISEDFVSEPPVRLRDPKKEDYASSGRITPLGGIPRTGYSESGKRNKRSVWMVPTQPYKGAHFATFPKDLITPCILAGCPKGGVVIDPFGGSGTTAATAKEHNRRAISIELNEDYLSLQTDRMSQDVLAL